MEKCVINKKIGKLRLHNVRFCGNRHEISLRLITSAIIHCSNILTDKRKSVASDKFHRVRRSQALGLSLYAGDRGISSCLFAFRYLDSILAD